MQGALLVTWGSSVPGREAKGLEVFGRALEYFEGLAKEGRIHGHREYICVSGNTSTRSGYMIIDGEIEELQRIHISDENIRLMTEASAILENFDVCLCIGGSDQAMGQAIQNYTEAMAGMGYM